MVRALSHVLFLFSTLVRCGEYRSQTGIQRKLNFVSVRTIKEGSSEARTILLLHIISVRPSKQPLMVRTFLKVFMELGSYFLFLQEQIKDIIIEYAPAIGICSRHTGTGIGTRDLVVWIIIRRKHGQKS
jgi:hypothetical protein